MLVVVVVVVIVLVLVLLLVAAAIICFSSSCVSLLACVFVCSGAIVVVQSVSHGLPYHDSNYKDEHTNSALQ